MTTTEQWYEVLRPDGKKQYATKTKDGAYLLYGYGFAISQLDAISITPVKQVPVVLIEAKAYWDDGPKFKALVDKNKCWNGWEMPYIHHSEIKKLCKIVNDGFGSKYILTNDIINVKSEDFEDYVIEPEIIKDEIYYDFGNEGWCWSFAKKKKK